MTLSATRNAKSYVVCGATVIHTYDDAGYPYVTITFPNGRSIKVEEIGQVGDISLFIDGKPQLAPDR